jgi:hypothetical protein
MFACEAQSPLAHACDGSLTPGGSARVGRKRRKGMERADAHGCTGVAAARTRGSARGSTVRL